LATAKTGVAVVRNPKTTMNAATAMSTGLLLCTMSPLRGEIPTLVLDD
jgi:hypothetical protein